MTSTQLASRPVYTTQVHESAWVDVTVRASIAQAVYNQVRRELNNAVGPWSAFDANEQQRIVDEIKPFIPAPTATPPAPVQEITGGLDDDARIGWAVWRIKDLEQQLAQAHSRSFNITQVQEPVWWNAVLDPKQVHQQLDKRLHRCGFHHERDAKAFIETELDFSGWRYTLVPLYTTPPPVDVPVAWIEYARKKPELRRLVFDRTPDKDLNVDGWVSEPLAKISVVN